MPILVILLLLCFIPPKAAYAHSDNHEIQMTKAGFVPQVIEIAKGESVTFKNIDSSLHWPASNIHPTHKIYPEFDPLKGIAPGSSWSFKFDTSGQWRFHDHLYPEFTGSISVKGEAKAVVLKDSNQVGILHQIMIDLKKLYYQIFKSALEKDLASVNLIKIANDEQKLNYWLEILGGDRMMNKLLLDSKNGSDIDCHQEAHKIGRLAYKQYRADVFQGNNSSCHSGYYHGAMEAFLAEFGTDNLSEKINQLCSKFKTSFTNFECLHGVGHGVLAFEDYDLPQALKLCQTLNIPFAQDSCFGGVFMENIITSQGKGAKSGHETKWVSSDPYFPCNGIDQNSNIQYQCYLMQSSRMLDLKNYSFSEVSKLCLDAPLNMKTTCFQSLGRDAAGNKLRDPEKTLQICDQVDAFYYSNCVQGALNVIVDFWGEKLKNQAREFCQMVKPGQAQTQCFTTLSGRMKDVFAN